MQLAFAACNSPSRGDGARRNALPRPNHPTSTSTYSRLLRSPLDSTGSLMSTFGYKLRQSLYGGLLLLLLSPPGVGQQVSMNATDRLSVGPDINTEPPPMSPQTILALFVKTESRVREALNQHTFKRNVTLQTIGPFGEVTGEYVRNSQFLFDDKGNRIERVFFHPASTIRELRITREDIQDLAGAQLLGIDITEKAKYRLAYAGTEQLGSREVFAFDVTPVQQPNPHRMRERFFVGRVWADVRNFQIVKVKGIVEPRGKQRFPMFQTVRAPIGDDLWFPTSTDADDILYFPRSEVHYRIIVRYYDYKRFAGKLTITEISEPPAHSIPALQQSPGTH
jgi:hypothetical protein